VIGTQGIEDSAGRSARPPKLSHAVLDIESRRRKAKLITDLIDEVIGPISRMDVLEIGTGSGYIASLIAPKCRSFVSVDIVDERLQADFSFELVSSEVLPFESASFDLVISNHVIEHVDDQGLHLRESGRVLREGGAIYLSTPNRYTFNEPHFRLPFLSWLPSSFRDSYVRLARKGAAFDVRPLSYGDLLRLAHHEGLHCWDIGDRMAARRIREKVNIPFGVVGGVWPIARHVTPTFVTVLQHRASGSPS
jgi:SAM-dependent methyltransferase